MQISRRVISDSIEFADAADTWSTLVGDHSNNPFLLARFVNQLIDRRRSSQWNPLLLLLSVNGVPVGISPLETMRKFGIRFARFLCPWWWWADFVVDNLYRDAIIGNVVDFLFQTLHCQFVRLTLPTNSANLPILKAKCRKAEIQFLTREIRASHSVLPVCGTWGEFESSRGRNFRRHFKKIARHLDDAGSWRITSLSQDEPGDTVRKILSVESRSWKEAWRTRHGAIDESLMLILKALTSSVQAEPGFEWTAWFLELDETTLAYALVVSYKETAFVVKTSFDEQYRRYYPGIFVLNAAVRELFLRGKVRSIDFLTSLKFHARWNPMSLSRVEVFMFRESALGNIVFPALFTRYANELLAPVIGLANYAAAVRSRKAGFMPFPIKSRGRGCT